MFRFISLLLLLSIGLLLAGVAGIVLSVEDTPRVQRQIEFTPAHIARAKALFDKHDPRRMRGGTVRTVKISADDLDLALAYLADRYGNGSAGVTLRPGEIDIAATFGLPANPFGGFISLEARLHETTDRLELDYLKLGRFAVPVWLVKGAIDLGGGLFGYRDEIRDALGMVRNVSIAKDGVQVVYEWRDDLPDRLRQVAVSADDRGRLRDYQTRLTEVINQSSGKRTLPLETLLKPLMQLAAERSASGDAGYENRALVAVVAMYVGGRSLGAAVPDARDWPRPRGVAVTLQGRRDFAQHFMISAALSAWAGDPLSNAIGLYKELKDSQGGSGFSFNDIAADRAGTVFGQRAIRSAADARDLQQRLAGGVAASDLMPEVSDLPEFMSDAEFKRRFGGVGEPRYEKMMAEIERRVTNLPLYR